MGGTHLLLTELVQETNNLTKTIFHQRLVLLLHITHEPPFESIGVIAQQLWKTMLLA